MKLLLKNTLKKIKKSLGRFLSITFIIALGISVFIGLREATAGMLYTADNYYDEHNLMDFKITSTKGLTQGDVLALEELKYTDKVVPSYSIDVLNNGESIRVHAIEKDVNNVTLVNGRMPKDNNECLADYYKYNIGDNISFDGKNVNDLMSISKCKVVGTIKSVLYIRDEKGISSVGNGKLVSFVFVNKDVFISKYYTDIYIIAKNTKIKNSYYEDYEKQVTLLKKELEELKPIRETIRYEEILKEANDEIAKIKKDLDEKINKSTIELENSKIKLDSGKKELDANKTKGIAEFENSYKILNDNKKVITDNLSAMGITESELDSYISNLSSNMSNLKSQLSLLTEGTDEYNELNNQILSLESNYNNLVSMKDNLVTINSNLDKLDNSYNAFKGEISKKETEITDGYNKYYEGMTELEKGKKEAEDKIAQAKEELNNIEKPEWYLLDRTDNNGYMSYKEDIIKVDAVEKILPIFFILIVILMISNTLTRLIEEERTEMGILQSNGFGRGMIIFSYLVYVFIAGLIGIGLGLTIGYSLIPKIIYGVFLSRYYAPKLITIVSPLPFSLVILVTLLIMTLVTIFACRKELKEVPANLLRPKPPKSGKKVIFEKNKLFWSKLSFMWKATIRNLFRYKKRIIMTVLGVTGCTALLLSGLGINDSVNTVSSLQYKDIVKYDSMYILDNEVKSIPEDLLNIFKSNGIVNPLLIYQDSFTFSFDKKTETSYLIVPSDDIAFNNYITMKSIKTNKNVSVNDEGVIITEKMAKLLKVNIGDMISVRNSDNELFMLYVSDIVENYISHYIYMSKNYYKEIFGADISYNSILADGVIDKQVPLTEHNILMVNYTSDILKSFDSFISGLNEIIIMIVVFACFLAFIVLYNLTIINVSERKREIATFKVLGFYNKEISTFIYRETLILTIIGVILGLFFGVYLHRFIINTSETDNVMFLRTISNLSYVLSALITIVFSFIVQLIVNINLKRIDMIDSLKSTE